MEKNRSDGNTIRHFLDAVSKNDIDSVKSILEKYSIPDASMQLAVEDALMHGQSPMTMLLLHHTDIRRAINFREIIPMNIISRPTLNVIMDILQIPQWNNDILCSFPLIRTLNVATRLQHNALVMLLLKGPQYASVFRNRAGIESLYDWIAIYNRSHWLSLFLNATHTPKPRLDDNLLLYNKAYQYEAFDVLDVLLQYRGEGMVDTEETLYPFDVCLSDVRSLRKYQPTVPQPRERILHLIMASLYETDIILYMEKRMVYEDFCQEYNLTAWMPSADVVAYETILMV